MTVELNRVREYRRAARLAVRAEDHKLQDRYLALIDLAEAARAEPNPLVRTWSERAVWQEAKAILDIDDEPSGYPSEPYEQAQHRLRNGGYSNCPQCLAVLATDADFERWAQLRADEIEELRRHEDAIDG